MPGRIPDNKIDEIRMAADIVEIISGYLTLKKRGRNFMGLCPFHNEKTPSFSVSPDKQIFHCFGCGKGGNVFTFLMEHEKMTFIEAVNFLADRYGIILPKYERETDTRTERMLFSNNVAADLFQANLKKAEYREKIEPYLFQKRGLTPETVEKFRIGLAADSWDQLIVHARTKDITPQELEEAGLVIKSDKRDSYYDRFRLRLMFPIFNLAGKVIGFGGRALRRGEQAKYMNSPETAIYNKSYVLYGMNFSKAAIRDAGTVILVEGYFDYLSLFQAGIENVAAVSGTAFTPQQAKLLARFAQKAYLFFDADSAGHSAALRSVEYFFNAGIEPIIVTPPPGHDPDSYVREHGPEAIYKLLEDGQPYLSFRFSGVDMAALTMRERENIAREIKSLASKIDDPLRRDVFVSQAGERLKLAVASLQPDTRPQAETETQPIRVRSANLLESEFLSLLITRPALVDSVQKDISPDDLRGPGLGRLYDRIIKIYREQGDINPDKMIEDLDDETEKSALAFISTLEWGDIDLAGVVREYRQMIINQKHDRQIKSLKQKLAEAEKKNDAETARKLTQEIKYLLDKKA